jgi:signal transduction histidine kinase
MQRHTPDLIISDINMPGMDGYTFFKTVRTNERWALIPFIFLTARDQPLDVRKGISMGVDQYVVKPFAPEDLLTAVEARLKRIREIETAARTDVEAMKHRLMTTITHELRTPLTYIYGFVNLLQEEQDNLSREEMDHMVRTIQRGADRLVRLVEDLLLIARLDSGEIEIEVRIQSIVASADVLVAEAVARQKEEAERIGVMIETKIPEGIMITCAPDRLRDAIARLVSNGIKFSRPPNGHIWISAEMDGDNVRIKVQDDGIGLSADKQKLLFQRFVQIDRQQNEQQGLGMGLMIARGIVVAHGGEIEVSSEGVPGQGCAFTIVVPAQASA